MEILFSASFIDTLKEIVGGFTKEQMLAIGAVALIALLLGFFIGAMSLYGAGVRKGKKQGEKSTAALAKKKMAESMKIEIDKALSKAKKENARLASEKEKAVKLSAELETEKQKAQEENERLQAEKEASLREKDRLAEEKARSEEEKARLAEEKAKTEEEKARLAEEKAKTEEEKARLLEEKDKAEMEKAALESENRRALEEKERLQAEKEASLREKDRLAEEKARSEEEKARLAEEKARTEEEKARLAEEKARTEEEKARLLEEKAKAEETSAALLAEKDKAEMEKERLLAEKEKAQESAAALKEQREREQAALNEAKERLEKAQSEARNANESAQEAQEKIKKLKESEAAAIAAAAGAAAAAAALQKKKKKKINLLSKKEILDYAAGLDEYLPANIYERGGEDLPDSCRVGICTFMLVYERKGMVKLVLRLHKKTASALQKQFKLFTKAVYPKGGDWYKWILSSEVTDLDLVTAAVRMSYKYVYLINYDEVTNEANVELANKEEVKINEAIVKYSTLADRDFIVASDATEWEEDAYGLYGKAEMSEYARSLSEYYPVSVSENDSPLSPSTFKVKGKTFMMAYEKDGVSKMIFRASDSEFAEIKRNHPKAGVSPFPKASGYKWYAVIVDETFRSNEDIEDIIRTACAHVNDLA
ncbi:MAG: hypothetical protein K5753_05065 [Clostridia bacterium]|nr:hypothetical protein [Clostridia bacterium]